MGRLLVLFIVVPAVELALLIEIGRRVGTLATLGLIVVTGILGAALARHQGLGVLRRVQAELAAGRVPAGSLLDGVFILFAGALLMTPGILTDAVGFLCLVPGVRTLIKRELWRRFERAVREDRIRVAVHLEGFGEGELGPPPEDPYRRGPTIDLGPEPPGPPKEGPDRDR